MKKTLLILILFGSTAAFADTRYVSDDLEIMVRSGKSPGHRIIASLKSGARINVLEHDKATGYSRINLSGDREGWVLSRLLKTRPSAKSRLAKAEATVARLKAATDKSDKNLSQLSKQQGSLSAEASELKKLNETLSRDLTKLQQTSSSAVQTLEERNQLQQRVVTIERELETLKRENDVLKNSDAQDWFLIGSGVLLFGIFLGFILPKLSWRKKSSWQSSF